ncbi:uncharacterized protein LOC128216941 [Mya arenaria]|uniref:uncharacterized protein LOC128216941 n=1 Tax=Mya arenaria TaxID=6604 RepID=UPI0022E542AB|nr:uncharacterized protein LOC128216941 [Mya arenaria]
MENGKCLEVFLCYLCVHIIPLLCFSCVFINGAQDMYVTNSTCGTEFSLDPSDDIRFHYDGGKVYDPNRSIYGRCEVKITNNHKGAELCVWAPYSRYTGVKNIDWTLKCSEMFQFGFTYRLNTMSCDEFLINEKCDIAKIAYATFREPFFHDEGLFIVRIFARYRGIQQEGKCSSKHCLYIHGLNKIQVIY